jgi:hypothetical protein
LARKRLEINRRPRGDSWRRERRFGVVNNTNQLAGVGLCTHHHRIATYAPSVVWCRTLVGQGYEPLQLAGRLPIKRGYARDGD